MRAKYPTILLAVLVLLGAVRAEGWCNRKEQAGSSAVQETFELPEIPPAAKPFSFERPDPARQMRQVEFDIDPSKKSVFLVAVSDQLSPQQATDVQAAILGLLSQSMCHPDDVMVVWSGNMRRIATLRNDERVRDCSSTNAVRFKVHENKAEIARLNQHFQGIKEQKLSGEAALNVPHLSHHLGQEFHEYPDYANRALVFFGSAVHVFDGERRSELEGAYPTVGMLRAPLSPFSTREKAWYLGNTVTHFVYTDRLTDRVHRDGLQNFWAAYFLSQGSPLLTFSTDPKVSERVLRPELPGIPAYVDDVTPGYISVRAVELFGEAAGTAGTVDRLERGAVVVGLKWESAGVDLDLHVGLRGQDERLSFRQPETSFGTLTKRYSTGWEVARLKDEVRPEDVELWTNFYRGDAPAGGVEGELRISYAGTLFRAPIRFAARSGNEGRAGSEEHWQFLSLADVLQPQ